MLAWRFRTSLVERPYIQVWRNAELKARIVTAVLLLSLGSGSVFAASQTSSFQFLGKPGPYPVGLKVFDQYDFSRTFVTPTKGRSESSVGKDARPLQTLIWYPSLKSVVRPMVKCLPRPPAISLLKWGRAFAGTRSLISCWPALVLKRSRRAYRGATGVDLTCPDGTC